MKKSHPGAISIVEQSWANANPNIVLALKNDKNYKYCSCHHYEDLHWPECEILGCPCTGFVQL